MSLRARRLLALLVLLCGLVLVFVARPASGAHLLSFGLVLVGGWWGIPLWAPRETEVRSWK